MNEKILLDRNFNSDSSLEKVLTEAFSNLKLDANGDVSCILSFEHLDQFVLENEKKMTKDEMGKILHKIDSMESDMSVKRSFRLYERSMRNADKEFDLPEEKDEDFDEIIETTFMWQDYHPYNCDCEQCLASKKVMDEMEVPSGDFFRTEEELRRDRRLEMRNEREERLEKKRLELPL